MECKKEYEVVESHENLEVWQIGIKLVKLIYQLTDSFPDKEKYRLTDQMCRAVVSIPSNIAEGGARKSTKEFMCFISISIGSLAELRTQIVIARELGYINKEAISKISALVVVLGKKLHGLYNALERKNA
ncbi:MAG: four helix bundle protein [Rickettsiales bacterium]